jgi:transposase
MDLVPKDQLEFVAKVIDKFDPPLRARKLDNKTAFQCLCFALLTGVAWKYVPSQTCSFSTAYKRFQCWVKNGVLENVWKHLLHVYAEDKLRQDPGWFKSLFIDTTFVKNLAGVDCVGANPTDRGRLGSKISVLCDTNRVAVGIVLYPANHSDCRTVVQTINSVSCKLKHDGRRTVHVVGDKAYNTQDVRGFLKSRRIRLVADYRKNVKIKSKLTSADKQKLKKRHTVENLFCRLKQFKRVRHRMDTFATTFRAEIYAASIVVVLAQLENNVKIRNCQVW